MVTQSINRLDTLINIIPDLLVNMDDADLTLKTSPEKWSKKEILGHLIDSATNNHQRFIRGSMKMSQQSFMIKTNGTHLANIKL